MSCRAACSRSAGPKPAAHVTSSSARDDRCLFQLHGHGESVRRSVMRRLVHDRNFAGPQMGLPTTWRRATMRGWDDYDRYLPGLDGRATCSPTAGRRSSCASWSSATPASTTSPAGCPASPGRCSCGASATSSAPASSSAGRRRPGKGHEYLLTSAGRDLEQVLMALGRWSVEWLYHELRPRDIDAMTLMWWMHRLVDPETPADRPGRRRVRPHRAGAHDDLAGASTAARCRSACSTRASTPTSS